MSDKNKKKQAQPEQCQEDIRKEEDVETEEEAVRTEQEEKGGPQEAGEAAQEDQKSGEAPKEEPSGEGTAPLDDRFLRLAAEYDNYRKRTAREADQKFNDGISFAVNQIIPILDTLEMAANAPTTDENYKKGVTMTLDKAAKALDVLHVEEIESLGKPFDPNFMNAVQQVPAEEGQESGTVVTVYQKGYKLGDKIVRHATVVVAE